MRPRCGVWNPRNPMQEPEDYRHDMEPIHGDRLKCRDCGWVTWAEEPSIVDEIRNGDRDEWRREVE
jgi:hypothetical protein